MDILVYDKDDMVRTAVAYQGRDKDLDILVNDEDYGVKWAVLKQNRDKDINILVNDNTQVIKNEAIRILKLKKHENSTLLQE